MLKALRYTLFVFVLCGVVYPFGMTFLAQAILPTQSNGSLIQDSHGKPIGSRLLAQSFTSSAYFQPRPSANNYDAANSGGSNLSTTSRKLADRITVDSQAYQKENGSGDVPPDAVTASASSLDPNISLDNAFRQAPRIAAARQVDSALIKQLIAANQAQHCGWFEKLNQACGVVDVLELNVVTDKRYPLSGGSDARP